VRQTDLQRRGAAPATGLQRWVDGLSASPLSLGVVGLSVAAVGFAALANAPVTWIGAVLCKSAMAVGGGLAFLGLDKGRRARITPPPPVPVDRVVLEERSRRIRLLMAAGGAEWTFDLLRARLEWTDEAMVEALLHMRDGRQIIEDLNLDSGKWVYRLQDAPPGSSATMTLDDRARRQ
jgi:hypothetical protein